MPAWRRTPPDSPPRETGLASSGLRWLLGSLSSTSAPAWSTAVIGWLYHALQHGSVEEISSQEDSGSSRQTPPVTSVSLPHLEDSHFCTMSATVPLNHFQAIWNYSKEIRQWSHSSCDLLGMCGPCCSFAKCKGSSYHCHCWAKHHHHLLHQRGLSSGIPE